MLTVRGHNAYVGGDHVGLKVQGKVEYALGALDPAGVYLRVVEAPDVPAEGRHRKAPVLDGLQELPALVGGQVLGGQLAVGDADLHAVHAQGLGLVQGLDDGELEALKQYADGKIIHNNTPYYSLML